MSLTPGGLCTARITTMRLPDERPQLLSGIYRMPAEATTAADNFAAGGLAAPIDLATGRLGPAVRKDLSLLDAPAVVHPQTGARIEGHQLTHWADAVSLVLRAHEAVGCKGVPVIGWDVALTAEGPVLVEGNNIPCSTLGQMALDAPLGDSPLLACINAHLRECFAARRPAA
jgi:Sugar-transfer associated ATP-grasp